MDTLIEQAESILSLLAGANISIVSGETDEGDQWFAIEESCCTHSMYHVTTMGNDVLVFEGCEVIYQAESFDAVRRDIIMTEWNNSRPVFSKVM